MTDTPHEFDFTRLSPAERIRLVQDIWDSLADDAREYPLTPAQERELEDRLAAADRGEMTYASWDEVKRRTRAGP